ncbi:hypothetical protein [Microcoleus sp. B5-D4]|uniref:hypothetical protein n=1 Tax=Microcoleus sp. B5-D4 TaxID=2818681 RepID=UPI002FCEDA9A
MTSPGLTLINFIPISPKYTPNKLGILTVVKGGNEVFCSKKPGCGANLVLASLLNSQYFLLFNKNARWIFFDILVFAR